MNNKTLTVSLLAFALLLAALVLRSGPVAWLALPFLFYLGAGILFSPARESVRLEAERAVSRGAPDGAPDGDAAQGEAALVEVTVTVRNRGANLARVDLFDQLPEGLSACGGETGRRAALRGGEELSFHYSLREKRGSHAWNAVRAVVSDPLGLVETEYLLPARGEIEVQPERSPLRRLPLRPRSTLHSPGSIPARRGGSGTDFWGVREYQPGDPLRWLDWRLTARHPRKFFTKEFEQEEIADVGLILDAREKTNLAVDGPEGDSLFEHSVSAAAALAEDFLHQGHRLSLLVYGGEIQTVFPGYGKGQLNKIMRCLANARPDVSRISDFLDYLPLRMFASRALLIVFSPLSRNDWPFYLKLRASGYQCLLVSPDPFDFALRHSRMASDPTGQLAFRAARLERCLELRDIAQLRIPVIDWQVNQPLYPLVREALRPSYARRDALQQPGGGEPAP